MAECPDFSGDLIDVRSTQLLNAIGQGDRQATAEFLPLVYAELKQLARAHMKQ
jgi:ECF sigma factor